MRAMCLPTSRRKPGILISPAYPPYVTVHPQDQRVLKTHFFCLLATARFFMNSEILAGLDFFERDKGIKREVLLEAINGAVLSAARKAVGAARDLRVEIDPRS